MIGRIKMNERLVTWPQMGCGYMLVYYLTKKLNKIQQTSNLN